MKGLESNNMAISNNPVKVCNPVLFIEGQG